MKKMSLPKPLFVEGGKRAVLLLHAYSGSPNDVRMVCRCLEERDYTVYSPMFSGHGTLNPSDIVTKPVSQWWQDTQAALAFLKEKGYQEIAVFGLSMGGIMAMRTLTLNDPAIIGGGAFCSPIYKTETNVPENFIAYAKKVLTYSSLSDTEKTAIMTTVTQRAESQLADIQAFGGTVAEYLANVNVPVFLAQSGKDEMINPQTVYQTMQGLQQTKVALNWYPNSGHVITVSQERKEFEQDVCNFIESLSWSEEK